MKEFIRGQRGKLSDLTSSTTIYVGVGVLANNNYTFDVSCFGLDKNNQLSDDRYLIFYNQKTSPCKSIISLGAKDKDLEAFSIDFSLLPKTICKLAFTLTIDGIGKMSEISSGYLRILAQDQEIMRFLFSGKDFLNEEAIIVCEIYWKDTWRIAAVGQGFRGGLRELLHFFGGQEDTSINSTETNMKAVNENISSQTNQKSIKEVCLLATQQFSKGNYQKALELYEVALKLDKNNYEIYLGISKVYLATNLHQKALEMLEKAIAINPNSIELYSCIATVYEQFNNWQEAIKTYLKIIAIDPAHVTAYTALGIIYKDMELLQDALQAFQSVIKLRPNESLSYCYLGDIYKELGMLEDAITQYKQAINLDPDDEAAYYDIGITYYKLGFYKEAIEAYNQVLSKSNIYSDQYKAQVHYNLGLCYFKSGLKILALKEYETLKTLDQHLAEDLSKIL